MQNLRLIDQSSGLRSTLRGLVPNVTARVPTLGALLSAGRGPAQEQHDRDEPEEMDLEQEEEPEEPEYPEEAEPAPVDPSRFPTWRIIPPLTAAEKLTPVSASDLPPDERNCFICGLEYSSTGTYITLEERGQLMDGSRIDEEEARQECVPVKLPCGHIVGDKCIHLWARTNTRRQLDVTCPSCRTVLLRTARPREVYNPFDSWGMAGMM